MYFKLIGGGNKDLYIGCDNYNLGGQCYGYLDPNKAMIFERILVNNDYFMLKTPDGYCISSNDFVISLVLRDCKLLYSSHNSWKNANGQVFNPFGRALWWDGDKSNTILILICNSS